MKSKNKFARSHSSLSPIRIPTHGEITARAQALWHQRGRVEGQDTQIWLQAEFQLYQEAEKRTKVYVAPRTIFDENDEPTHEVEMRLAEIGQPRGARTSL